MPYFAITGRIHGDWEDTLCIYGPCNEDQATERFKADLIKACNLDKEELRQLSLEVNCNTYGFPGYINSIVRSESPIINCSCSN